MDSDAKEKGESEDNEDKTSKSINNPPLSSSKFDSLKTEDLIAIVKKQYIMLNDTRKQLDVYKEQIHEKDEKLSQLTASNHAQSEEKASGNFAPDMLIAELKDYKQSLEATRTSLNKCQTELREKETNMVELAEKYQIIVQEKESVVEALRVSIRENEKIQELLDEKSKLITENLKEIDSLVLETSEIKNKMDAEIKSLKAEIFQKTSHLTEYKRAESKMNADYLQNKNEMNILKRKYEELQQEYSQFKERAQYVIKQQSFNESAIQESVKQDKSSEIKEFITSINTKNEEISLLKTRCANLEEELHISREHIATLELQLQTTRDNHTLEILREKENLHKTFTEFQTSSKTNENTVGCLKAELTSLLEKHEIKLEELKEESARCEALRKQNSTLQAELLKLKTENTNNNMEASPAKSKMQLMKANKNLVIKLTDNGQINACKNYNTEANFSNSFNDEEIVANSESEDEDLSLSLHSIVNNQCNDDAMANQVENDFWRWENNEEHDLLQKKEELVEKVANVEQQLAHTREVLAETEETNIKLIEQIQLFKEEFRRIERNRERQLHVIENSEYLKNVILKYLAPQKVNDERHQMLPVLKTMLKLTADEVTQIEKNLESSYFPSNNDADETKNSEWSNYFKGFF